MTASQPFTSKLISSNYEMFKYSWVWEKSRQSSVFNAKNAPLKKHEDICVFSKAKIKHKGQANRMFYNPLGVSLGGVKTNNPKKGVTYANKGYRRSLNESGYVTQGSSYPTTILKFSSEQKTVHPTQKPVALMEYLIKTYTNESETVLDFAMGSGSTGVACKNLNRKFIGIELDDKYFEIAKDRVNKA